MIFHIIEIERGCCFVGLLYQPRPTVLVYGCVPLCGTHQDVYYFVDLPLIKELGGVSAHRCRRVSEAAEKIDAEGHAKIGAQGSCGQSWRSDDEPDFYRRRGHRDGGR
jgi:hypothetical protein